MGDRIFELLLDCPFQGPGAIKRVESDFREFIQSGLGHTERQITRGQAFLKTKQLNPCNRSQMGLSKRMKNDNLVDPVDEFGPEMSPDLKHHGLANLVQIGFGG